MKKACLSLLALGALIASSGSSLPRPVWAMAESADASKIGAVAPDPDDFALDPCRADGGVGDLVLHDLMGIFNGDHIAVDADDRLDDLFLLHIADFSCGECWVTPDNRR